MLAQTCQQAPSPRSTSGTALRGAARAAAHRPDRRRGRPPPPPRARPSASGPTATDARHRQRQRRRPTGPQLGGQHGQRLRRPGPLLPACGGRQRDGSRPGQQRCAPSRPSTAATGSGQDEQQHRRREPRPARAVDRPRHGTRTAARRATGRAGAGQADQHAGPPRRPAARRPARSPSCGLSPADRRAQRQRVPCGPWPSARPRSRPARPRPGHPRPAAGRTPRPTRR